MLPFPCSTCPKKSSKSCCIIPDTEASLSYTIGVPHSNGIGVNFLEKDTDNGKVMYMVPVKTSDFSIPNLTAEEVITRGSCITPDNDIISGDLSMQIYSIDYNNTSDSADGSFVVTGKVTCPAGSYTMNLTATWAFEEVLPAQPAATVEESKSGS